MSDYPRTHFAGLQFTNPQGLAAWLLRDTVKDRSCLLTHPPYSPPRRTRDGDRRLILTRQEDYIVGVVQNEFIERKVGELQLLGEHGAVVAIFAGESGSFIRTNL